MRPVASGSPDGGTPRTPDGWDGIRRIAEASVDDLDTIVDGLLPRVLAIPQYQKIPVDDLRSAVATNVSGTLVGLIERRLPTAEDLAVHEGLIEGRVHQRLPLEAILDAFRIGGLSVWDGLEQHAQREGVPADAVLAAAKLVWRRVDVLMTSAAVAYRQAELAMVHHDQQRQSDFLRDLLLGDPDSSELNLLAPAFGLSLDRPYVCFRARASEELSLRELRRMIAAGARDARSGLIGIIQGDLVGVLPEVPRLTTTTIAVGIGPPTRLSTVNSSFPLASRALDTALAFGMTGVFGLDDIALRAAVVAEDLVGSSLADRYLRPLPPEQGPDGGVLETTVREFLAQGMRVDQTARALFVHPNTLRKRLHRFEQRTGADLGRVEDIVGIWWALQRRELKSHGTGD